MMTAMRYFGYFLAGLLAMSAAGCGDGRGDPAPDAGTTVLDPRFESCATATTAAALKPAYVMFVLDGSGSMMDDNKWTVVQPAMKSLFASFAQKADPTLAAGLIVFADSLDPTGSNMGIYGPYPQAGLDVPIGFVDSAAPFTARLSGMPKGLTPIQESLTGAYQALHAYQPSGKIKTGGRKLVVFMTDGFPFSSIPSEEQVTNSLAAAEAATKDADPISTFAVGIGSFPAFDLVEYDPTFLGRLAVAGGTRRTSTCDPMENATVGNVCYYQVTPSTMKPAAQLSDEFQAQLDEVRRQALACEFELGAAPDGQQLNPAKLNISYTDSKNMVHTIGQSATSGWSYDNPTDPKIIHLNGTACDDYRASGGKISIVLGCETIIL